MEDIKIDESGIAVIYKALYNEMVDAIKAYISKVSQCNVVDTKIVYRYYDGDWVSAIKISKIYIKDGELWWTCQYYNAEFGYNLDEVDFGTDCWGEEQEHLVFRMTQTGCGGRFDIELMDEIIWWINNFS